MEPARGGGRAPLAPLAPNLGPEQRLQPGSAGKARPGPQDFTHYHTGWMDKQEAAFQAWLNTVLAPAPADVDGSSEGSSTTGHRGLASRRLTARLRGLLWQLYSQDQELVSVMLKVEQRIDSGQLKLRDEESLMKNVKEAANARAVLGCYHPLWLRLGAEVVVGKGVAANDGPVSASELVTFVREHFFKDPQLARQYTGSGKAYWAALARLVLKRFLLLAALLDRVAQLPALPSAAPLLFRRDSKLKTSVQVLTEFVLPRLAGEGDVVRTLGRLGYKLAYVQDPRRELDFAVSNMATDLRDGLRLCKLAELLTSQNGFFNGTRFPSDRRPVRVANMQLALDAFARAGLPLQGAPRSAARGGGHGPLAAGDLVDGDREMTLCLLWRLILHFQLPQLISLAAIRAEVELVQAKAPAAPGCMQLQPTAPAEGAAEAGSPHAAALLSWVQAVCAHYGLPVRSFGAGFGDGSAFCLLIHHYLGHSYIALKDVHRSAQPMEAADSSAGWAGGMGTEQVEGARRNFARVQGVVLSLGGIPAMVSAEDFVEHGYDEKGCILFTAFLCQRLLEISKEERAALVIQRQWRNRQQHKPGTARDHLHQWIAAATVVQRAVRAWLLRRGLQRFAERRLRGVAAVVRLQALWRARKPYRQYQALRKAAITVQAAYRGKLARRAVFHTLVVPRMLEAGLRRKRQIEASRYQGRLERAAILAQARWRGRVQRRTFLLQRSAAVTIQAAVRGWQQQRRFQQQRAAAVAIQCSWRRHCAMRLLAQTKAAVVLQKHFRAFVVRRQLAQQQTAATTIQTAWRGWYARQQFLQQREAATAVQTAWRAYQARLLLQQHKAARTIQAVWRGHAVRQQVAQQQRAAAVIQAAWRCFAARRAFLQQRQAAVRIQAAWRCHVAHARFQQQRTAAVRIQAAFRGFAVRHLLQRNQAATAIQCHLRGFLVRRRLERERAAAVTIQRAVRAHQERRRQAAVAAVKQQMAEMAALMREYQRRTASALRIQAAYRGHKGRCEYRRLLAERQERQRQQAEREAAALAVIAPWAATFKARTWFLRARHAAPVLQTWWRREFARRQAAAVTIQAMARGWLVRRHLQRSQAAALCIQTAWRGWHVREAHPRRKQLADIRARLAAATINAANAPHRSLGARTHAFLDALLASKHPTSATAALNGLALCTEAVLACSDIVVAGGGLPVLLGIAKAPGRGKEAAEALRATLTCLANICRSRQHGDAVFAADGLLHALGDHLQQQRDKEDVFMAVVALWQRLVCGQPARALALARQPEVLAKLEGVARLLSLKLDGDKKYLTKLEQQKGSDVSARQATKALLAGQRQLRALRAVLAATGASREANGDGAAAEAELQLGKNTLVRAVLREQK